MKKDYRYLELTINKIVSGKWSNVTEKIKVEVMAVVGNYAMVRRRGCGPFICAAGDLTKD